jgi:hypothetical protein
LREVRTCPACGFNLLRGLLKTRGHVWGAAGATPFRLGVGTLGVLLHPVAPLFSRWNGPCGGSRFDGHRCRDGFAQCMLPREEVRRVMRPKGMFHIGQKARASSLVDGITRPWRLARAGSMHSF